MGMIYQPPTSAFRRGTIGILMNMWINGDNLSNPNNHHYMGKRVINGDDVSPPKHK
jgi:hypothetical protein